jgi:1-deoxy-D-xylulose-5-phosphate reductoisomerase
MKKRIAILGSTGSVGLNALRVVDNFPGHFEVVGLTAGDNVEGLSRLIKKYRPRKAAVLNSSGVKKLKRLTASSGVKIFDGLDGINEIAACPEADLVVVAISGSGGLIPVFEAVKKGKTIALANKESIVMAGALIMKEARRSGAKVIPVDSEHSAIFQCLEGRKQKEILSVILTCSGGPFYYWLKKKLCQITPSMALRHPRWKMGKKVTIDSATLMNKGLEIIEATYLFGVKPSQVEVVIHPEAVIHGGVEFIDGMFMGVLAPPDMRLPIQHALFYPERKKNIFPRLDLVKAGKLNFYSPDEKKFPCLALARHAREAGGTMPAVLNGANEVSVDAFLKGDIRFLDIPAVVEKVMRRHKNIPNPSLNEILAQDRWAKQEANGKKGTDTFYFSSAGPSKRHKRL